jgi:adenylate cyclase
LYEGKAVIVGKMDWDVHWTAVGAMPGPEVQANALHTLISGKFIQPMAPWSYLALLFVFAAATAVCVRRFKGWRSIGAVIVLMVLAVVVARQLLVQRGVWMYFFYCELGILLAAGITTVTERGKVAALLGRFVPSFIGEPAAPRLGEVRTLDASILFSDIRGFTGTAEQLSAEDMLTMLHTYHSAVEDIITAHGGTIVKTPGDAILAVFWQELRGVNHAACALQAGQELLADVPTFAGAWEAAGVVLEIGVGINAGPVAIGLVGTRHLEPTVIGDPVNVAQRLESLTKTLGYPLIFSESVHARLREDVEAVCLDEVTLAGRKMPITVYGMVRPEDFSQLPDQDVDHADRENTNES